MKPDLQDITEDTNAKDGHGQNVAAAVSVATGQLGQDTVVVF